jgi:ribose 5-phosphate isomerase B
VTQKKNIKNKNIFLASDHAGFILKKVIKKFLYKKKGIKVLDLGTNNMESVDYPDYAHLLSKKIKNTKDIGILICGSGTGMMMSANRHKGIRAALCYNLKSTGLSRLHNNANVMAIGSRLTKKNTVLKCVNKFLSTDFEGGRHLKRIKKI